MSERTLEQQAAYNHLWRRINDMEFDRDGGLTRHELIDEASRLDVRGHIIDVMLGCFDRQMLRRQERAA